jgi:hypothetical protein
LEIQITAQCIPTLYLKERVCVEENTHPFQIVLFNTSLPSGLTRDLVSPLLEEDDPVLTDGTGCYKE